MKWGFEVKWGHLRNSITIRDKAGNEIIVDRRGHVTLGGFKKVCLAATSFWDVCKRVMGWTGGLPICITIDTELLVRITHDGYVEFGPAYVPGDGLSEEFWDAVSKFCPVHMGTSNSPYGAF